jgi:hypothetical protein
MVVESVSGRRPSARITGYLPVAVGSMRAAMAAAQEEMGGIG